jgi:hypothetical protein
MSAAGNAEQARHLGHCDRQSGARLESHQDTVADEAHQHAQPQEPRDQAKQRHHAGREAGDLGVALRIAVSHRRNGPRDHQGNRRSRSDCELARGAKQGVTEPTQQIAVNARLRGQPRKSGISQGNWNRVGRQRRARDYIAGQPFNPIVRQPASCWYMPKPSWHALLCHRISRCRDRLTVVGGRDCI